MDLQMNPLPSAAAHMHQIITTRGGVIIGAMHALSKAGKAGFTEGSCGDGGEAAGVALVADDARLGRTIAVHDYVGHVLGDGDVLLVIASLHVDGVAATGALGYGVDGLVDGLEVAAPVLGDHRVGLLGGGQLQEPPLVRRQPLREVAGRHRAVHVVEIVERSHDARGQHPVAGLSRRGAVYGVELALDPRGHVDDLRDRGGQELAPSGELVGELCREKVALYLGRHVGDSVGLDRQKAAPAGVIISGGIVVGRHAQQPASEGVGFVGRAAE
jgi:hypothetical protein